MKPDSVILLQGDQRLTQSLIVSFPNPGYSVYAARSLEDLRTGIAKYRAKTVVLDMELAPASEVQKLSHEFPGIRIVCNHRLADEQMWVTALNAGAADVLPSSETGDILAAAMGQTSATRSAAAA